MLKDVLMVGANNVLYSSSGSSSSIHVLLCPGAPPPPPHPHAPPPMQPHQLTSVYWGLLSTVEKQQEGSSFCLASHMPMLS